MIRHHKVVNLDRVGPLAKKQLGAISRFIRRGVADAKESITLTAEACDAKGAKRFDNLGCVLARVIERKLKPEAVSVARGITYIVFDGVAVRFVNNGTARSLVDNWDSDGVVFHRPVTFTAPDKSKRMFRKKTRGGNGKKHIVRPRKVVPFMARALAGGAVVRHLSK